MTVELKENEITAEKETNQKRTGFHWNGGWWIIGVLLAVVLAGVALLFLGPQTGSVFSAVSKGIGGSPNSASSPSSNSSNTSSQQAQPWDRKIIRNATLSLTVKDVELTLAQLRALAGSEGGVVFQENTSQPQSADPTGTIVLQIPAQSFDQVVTRIRQMAVKVTHQETTSQDVTEEYVDLKSQIDNLQRTEAGLQKLLDKAQKLEDVVALERELGNVRGEIEKRQGRLNFLDKRTTFSNITVNLALPPVVEPAKTEPGWQPGAAVSEAWNASVKVLGKAVLVLLRVSVFLWWFWPFLTVGLVWWQIRRTAARRAESKPRFK